MPDPLPSTLGSGAGGLLAVGLAATAIDRLRAAFPFQTILEASSAELAFPILSERRVLTCVAGGEAHARIARHVQDQALPVLVVSTCAGAAADVELLVRDLTINALESRVLGLIQANAHLESLAVLGRLSSGVLHEVGNGLDAARRYLGLGLREDLPDHLRSSTLKDAQVAIDRTVEILRTMLAFAKGQPRPEPERPLSEILSDAVRLAENLRGEVSLVQAWEPTSLLAPTFVQQVVLNLLRNAYRAASPNGEVRLVARIDPARLRITVEDSGVGFSPTEASELFVPFGGTRRASPGLGLGLSLSKSLAERAGGTLEAASEGPSRGARFTLTLPRSDQSSREKQP